MRNLFSYLVSGATLATTLFTVTSCDDYSIMSDSDIYQGVKTENYNAKFTEVFGQVDKNQLWDFSTYAMRKKGYVGGIKSLNASTRAYTGNNVIDALNGTTDGTIQIGGTAATLNNKAGNNYLSTYQINDLSNPTIPTDWYAVESGTINWLNTNLIEGKNHTNLGNPFVMEMPDNKIAIIPIYQGKAGEYWDLHLVDLDADKDYNIWRRNTNILYRNQTENNNYWISPTTYNGSARQSDGPHSNSNLYYYGDKANAYNNEHTYAKQGIIGRPIIIDNTKLKSNGQNDDIMLYLHITEDGDKNDYTNSDKFAAEDTKQRSDEGMMLALSCPSPTNLNTYAQSLAGKYGIDTFTANSECMIIGAEDANLGQSDWDMNDVVFLVVGFPKVPTIKSVIKKRYMLEDLGATDYDFNDLVVDVTQEESFHYENGAKAGETYKQTAEIKAFGGTLPFILSFEDADGTNVKKKFNEINPNPCHEKNLEDHPSLSVEGSVPVRGTTPADGGLAESTYKYEVTGKANYFWKPDENNLVAYVKTGKNDGVYTKTSFPETGTIPLMIAVDQDQAWQDETVHIPDNWITAWYHGGSSVGGATSGNGGGSGTTPTTPTTSPNGTVTIDNPLLLGNVSTVTTTNSGYKWLYMFDLSEYGYDGSADIHVTVNVKSSYYNNNQTFKGCFQEEASTDDKYNLTVQKEYKRTNSAASGSFEFDIKSGSADVTPASFSDYTGQDCSEKLKTAAVNGKLYFLVTWCDVYMKDDIASFTFTWGNGDQGTPNTNLNDGPVTIASKSDGNYNQAYYTFDNYTADGLQTGDVLVITANKNNFELVFNNDWQNIYTPESKGNNTYELVLTDAQVSAIKSNHKIILNGGNNVTISALTVRKGSGGQQGGGDQGGGTTLFEGSKDLAWANWEINQNISANDVIKIDYTASNGGQMQVYNGGWGTTDKETVSLTTDSQSHTVTVTAKGTWIVLQGQNCTVTKIYK